MRVYVVRLLSIGEVFELLCFGRFSRALWIAGYRQSLFIQMNRSKALLIKDVFLFVNMNYPQ